MQAQDMDAVKSFPFLHPATRESSYLESQPINMRKRGYTGASSFLSRSMGCI